MSDTGVVLKRILYSETTEDTSSLNLTVYEWFDRVRRFLVLLDLGLSFTYKSVRTLKVSFI